MILSAIMTKDLRVYAKIIFGFAGSGAGPDARHEGGSVFEVIHDRPSNNTDGQRPSQPCRLRLLGSLALLAISCRPQYACISFGPRQQSQVNPAISAQIFAHTLSPTSARRTNIPKASLLLGLSQKPSKSLRHWAIF